MPKTATSRILRVARSYVERGWTQRAFARNGKGRKVPLHWPSAVCWCLDGAICLAWLDTPDFASPVYERVETAIGTGAITTWNDAPGRTQAEVLAALDAAIAAEEE